MPVCATSAKDAILHRPSSPATVIHEPDAGVSKTRVSVLIIGGGPHALAALSALHESSFAFGQFTSDNAFQRRVGFKNLQKIGMVGIIDPNEGFCEGWNKRFASLEIEHLRSPALAHPLAFEPMALVNFALREGREGELLAAPFVSSKLADEGFSMQDPRLYSLPSTALFRDFCASLEAKLPHEWYRGYATRVAKDGDSGEYMVSYECEGVEHCVVAEAVIFATGPTGTPIVPSPFLPFMGSPLGSPKERVHPRVTHTAELLGRGSTMADGVVGVRGARVLVVGGGLTAAQAALAAVGAGAARVVLRSRRPLQTRAYDLHDDWIDMRKTNRLRFDFLCMEDRCEGAKRAAPGGTVPASYMEELRRGAASDSSALELQVDGGIEQSAVRLERGELHVDGDAFDLVILATGAAKTPLSSRLYQQVQADFSAPVRDGFPRVDTSLRWADGEDLFVVGANAVLELGPGALNLMGAMRGAKIIAVALRDLMWTTKRDGAPSAVVNVNSFSCLGLKDAVLLGFADSSDEEDAASSSDDEQAVVGEAVRQLSSLSVRPAASKKKQEPPLSKAKAARLRARKHRRATKASKGM